MELKKGKKIDIINPVEILTGNEEIQN